MQRYFFHLRRGRLLLRDQIGMALPDLASAVCEAHDAAMISLAGAAPDRTRWRIEVADEHGRTLLIYPFAHATKATKRLRSQAPGLMRRARDLLHQFIRCKARRRR